MYELVLVLSVVVFVATCLVYARQPSASCFHPVTFYLMFHGFVFVIRPIFAWYYEFQNVYDYMHFTPTVTDKTEALLSTNLALVVFVFVSLLIIREPFRFLQGQHDLTQRPMLLKSFWPIAIAMGALALYATWWLFDYMQEFDTIAELDQLTGSRAMKGTNGYFYSATVLLVPIVAMIAFLGRFRLWIWVPFLIFAVTRFANGSRGGVVAAALIMALLYMYDRRRNWPTWTVVVAVMVLVPIFDTIQNDRGARLRQTMGFKLTEYAQRDIIRDEKPLESLDFAMLEQIEYLTWSIPEKSGSYDYFLGNLQILTEPIPRVLWKDKPIGAPIKLFDLYAHGQTISGVMSVPGMGWMYWGFPGVAIWAAVFALIYGLPYKALLRSKQSNLALMAYVIFVSTAVIGFRDGTILAVLKQCLFFFPPVVALIWWSKALKVPSAEEIGRQLSQQTALPLDATLTPRERRRRASRAMEAIP